MDYRLKSVFLFSLLMLLSGCTERQFVHGVEVVYNETTQFMGIKDRPNTMQKPSYYSTRPIQDDYELGRVYEIEHLDCESESNRCLK
ncbi:hypothetical protein [Thiomicrorhabdus sediminis]|uniref:Uncharacterized protein n=1 Tax=Thiomicrorhabdus sediminis TaxID=2580412 RepID=A0A4P9K6L2_9GAMM|nr:hypothetical protein [Thiomicrorhabdus sediminis]QCU90501.1 hypothetical protein FE785_07570 [Thiomicrorhabdus sediminis]